MANNYCESSSLIHIPADKLPQATTIVQRITTELEEGEDEYAGFASTATEEGMWLHTDESINTEHLEKVVKALVEELELPGIHVCSWAFTCSKPRIDQFDGGAFAVRLGRETIWINAANEVRRLAEADV